MRYKLRRTDALKCVAIACTALVSTVVAMSSAVVAADDASLPWQSSDEPRIVGGDPASIADFPYFVRLTSDKGMCGGTLIRKHWVLTAAHCVDNVASDGVVAHLGDGAPSQPQTIRSDKIEVHPDYAIELDGDRLVSVNADIALVHLSRPANLARQTIDRTSFGRNDAVPRVGSEHEIIGWGLTDAEGALPDQLQKALVTVKRCDGTLLDETQAEHICASGDTTTGCFGDSGGPLLVRGRVVGVFSYVALDCSAAPNYGVYTRVSVVQEWIDRTIQVRCNGLPATVRIGRGELPTDGPDVIVGTAGDDVISGLGGDDVICGFRGDDRIDGDAGNDWVRGNKGDDRVRGGPGDDELMGNTGQDELDGGLGEDRCRGGRGRDQLTRCESRRR